MAKILNIKGDETLSALIDTLRSLDEKKATELLKGSPGLVTNPKEKAVKEEQYARYRATKKQLNTEKNRLDSICE